MRTSALGTTIGRYESFVQDQNPSIQLINFRPNLEHYCSRGLRKVVFATNFLRSFISDLVEQVVDAQGATSAYTDAYLLSES